MIKNYHFTLQFLVAYTGKKEFKNTDLDMEEVGIEVEAFSYEEARTHAFIRSHEIIKNYYSPMGIDAFVRVLREE
jgi:hypothetical protein